MVVKALPFPDKGAMKSNLVSKGLMTIQWKPRHTDAMVVQLRWLLKRVNGRWESLAHRKKLIKVASFSELWLLRRMLSPNSDKVAGES